MPVKVKEMHDPAQAYVYGFLKKTNLVRTTVSKYWTEYI